MSKKFIFFLGSFLLCGASLSMNVGNDDSLVTSLPDLAEPTQIDTNLFPTQSGSLKFKGALERTYFSVAQDFNSDDGTHLVLDLATQRIPETTLAWLVSSKKNQIETVMNMGWRFGLNQQLLFSAAQLRELVDFGGDGKQNINLNQLSSGLNYRYFLDHKWLSGLELSGYASSSPGKISSGDTFQGIAGSNLYGVRMEVETSPSPDAKLHIGIGRERLTYDNLSGADSMQHPDIHINTSIKWSQILLPTLRYKVSLESNGVERNLSTGVDFNWRDGHQLGVKLARTDWIGGQGNDGPIPENAIRIAYTYQFGNKFEPYQSHKNKAPWRSSLVPEVLERPSYLPDSVLAKPESSLN